MTLENIVLIASVLRKESGLFAVKFKKMKLKTKGMS
jgi:hypothetical protein